jgi:ubiquinol-cytochrome c reductase cytochrome c1 subunit
MKKLIALFIALVMPAMASAAGGKHLMYKADVDLTNTESLQRGARMFVNYCMGCHSLKFMSYGRMARDLKLSEDMVLNNLMFRWGADKKIGAYMTIPMPATEAKKWFVAVPPDLSVVSRSRGVDWLYNYLLTFVVDSKRPFGMNNLTFKNANMPHVLWQLEGLKKAVYKKEKGHDGKEHEVFDRFEYLTKGTMTPDQYRQAVRDLVAFLAYVGEPGKVAHQRLGVWVLLFLAIFFVVSYMLKKEYWRDVH